MSRHLTWFRMYADAVDNEKLRMLAYEDRWHYVAILCLKCQGVLDSGGENLLERKIAVKLGVQLRELDEIKRRLVEVELIDENYQPTGWAEKQFTSDRSTDRVRRYRERQKKSKRNGDETLQKRSGNATVTAQDTDTDTDTDTEKERKEYCASAGSIPTSKNASHDCASHDAPHTPSQIPKPKNTGPPVYRTKNGRKLTGEKMELFERFWHAFDLKKGKAAAADSWLNIKPFSRELAETIIAAAAVEARGRPELIKSGITPKWAQGWLTDRRWEDYQEQGQQEAQRSRPYLKQYYDARTKILMEQGKEAAIAFDRKYNEGRTYVPETAAT